MTALTTQLSCHIIKGNENYYSLQVAKLRGYMSPLRGSVAVWAATRCGRVAVPSAPTLATIFSITSYARFELLGEPYELLGIFKRHSWF